MKKQIEKILTETLSLGYTAYHGDAVIMNIDEAAKKIARLLKNKKKSKAKCR